jgi:hypothetical protein
MNSLEYRSFSSSLGDLLHVLTKGPKRFLEFDAYVLLTGLAIRGGQTIVPLPVGSHELEGLCKRAPPFDLCHFVEEFHLEDKNGNDENKVTHSSLL